MIGESAALILRFDGLLFDTEEAEFQSLAELFANFGLTLSAQRWGPTVGVVQRPEFWLDWLESDLGHPVDHFGCLVELTQRELAHELRLTPNPAAVELVRVARAEGIPVGVMSDSPWRLVRRLLERFELRTMFDAIVTREVVGSLPPAPDLTIEVLRRLDVPRLDWCRALVIEHSETGCRSAKRSGARVVCCPGRFNSELPALSADRSVGSLAELSQVFASLELLRV